MPCERRGEAVDGLNEELNVLPQDITSESGSYLNLSSQILDCPHWYVAYTAAHHEKCVGSQLQIRSVEHFLPLYESVRNWKDRRVKLQLPLFPGYVFVHLALRDRLKVLQVPGVVRLVGFNGQACALQDSEIEAIQSCLAGGISLEPHPYNQVGRRVRIKAGPLQGLEGFVIKRKNRMRFIISLDLIKGSASVKVDEEDIQIL
jgi:transcription antitermination factor NusG